MATTDPQVTNLGHDTIIDEAEEQKQWYAMRATFRRELKAKDLLDASGIETFIPMHNVVKQLRGRRVKLMEPVIHNLLFVRCEKSVLQTFKAKVPFLQYMTTVSQGKRVPIVVPDKQMDDFIQVANTYDSQLLFLEPGSVNLTKGARVKIHGGPFDGLEGVLTKVQGKRNKRVVVAIQNVIAVAFDYLEPDSLEYVKP